ncbi:hypothetical protein PG984_014121 [Apiospora sp. TS-2023a]
MGSMQMQRWLWIDIENYTQRNLTYPSDSLNGFRGFLNHYRQITGGKLLDIWGLPYEPEGKPCFKVESLCWSHNPISFSEYGVPIGRRADFPSWSWAGWSGAVSLPDYLPWARLQHMELIKVMDGSLGPNSILKVNAVFLKTDAVRQCIEQKDALRIHAGSETRMLELSKELVENELEYRLALTLSGIHPASSYDVVALILQWTPERHSYARVGVAELISPGGGPMLEKSGEWFYQPFVGEQERQVILIE